MRFGKGSHHTEAAKARMSEIAKGDGRGTFLRTAEMRKRHSISAKVAGVGIYPRTEEHRRHTGEAQMGEKHWLFGKHHSEETRKKISEAVKRLWEDSIYRENAWEKSRKATLKLWQDPEYRAKVVKATFEATRVQPNNSEQFLIDFFHTHNLPFQYVGDGEFILGGKCPDFLNTDGQKQLIELFGIYYHNPQLFPNKLTESGLAKHYQTYGFSTLIIWEDELEDEEKLLSKVKQFERRE